MALETTRRETLRLLGLGGLGLLVQGASAACSFRYAKPILGPESDVLYLPADELAYAIKAEYGVCVGVADPSTTGAAYWDSDIKPAVGNAAIRAYHRRCGLSSDEDVLNLDIGLRGGLRLVWLAGRSFDKNGEEKGPAAMVFEDNALDGATLIKIVERYGT